MVRRVVVVRIVAPTDGVPVGRVRQVVDADARHVERHFNSDRQPIETPR